METNLIKKNEALNQMLDRHKALSEKCSINIFSYDDTKQDKEIKSVCFDLNKKGNEFFIQEFLKTNKKPFTAFMNLNLLEGSQRLKKNIVKILYVFIDLDDANEHHNDLIMTYLEKIGITYSYNAKSGHGYHFLIPVDLEPDMQSKVRGFLLYLKSNVCDKVDLAVHTNERLIRVPESWHYKDLEAKKLETYYAEDPSKADIKSNSELLLNYQEEQKKGKKDDVYDKNIRLSDTFFSKILSNKKNWFKYYTYLNEANERNDNFIESLGFFIHVSPDHIPLAKEFIAGWEPARWLAIEGWKKKAAEFNNTPLYFKLHKWAKANNIKEWEDLLKAQISESFLDEYEFYYLDDEKKDSNVLHYYRGTNHYVQKSFNECILSLIFKCQSNGIDLVSDFGLNKLEDWDEKSYTQQKNILVNTIQKKIETENRLIHLHNINYEPSDEKFVWHNGIRFFNTYTSTELWKYYEKKESYQFPHIEKLIRNLTGNEENQYVWFIKWLAHIIQNPTQKLPTAVILQGEPGSGKGTFKSHILDNIFGNNCQEINQSHLESSFNEYLLGKQIIVANEVVNNDNKQTVPNILKNLVTDSEITISRKFRKEVVGKNYTHWIFCSNAENPLKIDPKDRRYSVFWSPKLEGGSRFVTDLMSNIDTELKEFISYLKDVKVEFHEVHEPIMTKAKEDIISINQTSFERFIEFTEQFKDLLQVYIGVYDNPHNFTPKPYGDGDHISIDKVFMLYQHWCEAFKERGIFSRQMFSRKMANLSIKAIIKKEDGTTRRMYKISDIEINAIKSNANLI